MNPPIVTILHGSHLYGLNTPNSDMDYKSIFIPTLEEVLMGTAKDTYSTGTGDNRSKNTSADTDHMHFSLMTFVKMLIKGEMVAMDMIHAPLTEQYTTLYPGAEAFIDLYDNRSLFYCKDMRAYIGYVRKQAAKYGIKGTRIHALREVLESLRNLSHMSPKHKIHLIKDKLPENEYVFKYETGYEVLGKLHQWTITIEELINRISSALNDYGHRALQAEINEGVDFKALSHAFRAGYQLLDMFENHKMTLPLSKEVRDIILPIKTGERDFKTWIQPALEELIDNVNKAALKSSLPDSVDKDKIYQLVYGIQKRHYIIG
jgi:hypothetical protein